MLALLVLSFTALSSCGDDDELPPLIRSFEWDTQRPSQGFGKLMDVSALDATHVWDGGVAVVTMLNILEAY